MGRPPSATKLTDIRTDLADRRSRGQDFDEAWAEALDANRPGVWLPTLRETEAAWRAAFENTTVDHPGERAMLSLDVWRRPT